MLHAMVGLKQRKTSSWVCEEFPLSQMLVQVSVQKCPQDKATIQELCIGKKSQVSLQSSEPLSPPCRSRGRVCILLGGWGVELQHPAPGSGRAGEGPPSYQAEVQSVVVVLRHGQVHGQGHAVGKDGE